MRIRFFLLAVVITLGATFVVAETAVKDLSTAFKLPHVETVTTGGNLKGSKVHATVKKDLDLSAEEERGAATALARFKSLFGRTPNKPVELTDKKLRQIQTYAKSNPDKWYAMAYYLNYAFGISLVIFLAYGAYFLGWRFVGAGTSH